MTGAEVVERKQHPLEIIASDDFKAKVANALPDRREVERFTRVALTALQLDPDLLKHDQKSLYNSLLRCAQDGLLPDQREAALVVFGGKVQYMPMVTGLRKRAAEFGISIAAHVVCANDEFHYALGFEPTVQHVPPTLDKPRGKPIGAYAVATDKSGRKYLEVMSHGEIEKVRGSSRAKGAGPWTQWWEEMARKTVARRLFKSLPLHEEAIASLLEAVDHEFEHKRPEDEVDAAIGYVGPPLDNEQPDDTIDGEAVEVVDESAGEPEAGSGGVAYEPVAQAAGTDEPASPAEPPLGEQTSFEAMAQRAQRGRRAKTTEEPS